jgi:LacI family transcriptional regulator
VLDTDPHEPGVHSIVVDNAAGSIEATRHLLESVPANRCYFVGGPPGNFDTAQRAEAFSRTLRESGGKPRKDQVAFGEYSFAWGQRWARGVLPRLDVEPIGVLAGNDEIAYGVLRTFQDAGRPAPERLRIVGFDDTRLASLLRPTLSTVRVPMAEIGAAAVAALVDRIEQRDGRPACARIPTQLVVRESSRA